MANPAPFGLNRLTAQNRDRILIALIVALAIVLRFFHLGSMPPALSPAEAGYGLNASGLLHAHGFGDSTPFTQLYVTLLAACVAIFGHTSLALRIVGAVAGVAAVGLLFVLVDNWLGRRAALVSATLMAASPWAITLSRNVTPWTLVPAGSLLVLWLALLASRSVKPVVPVALAVALGLSLYAHPVFWILLAILAIAVATHRRIVADTAKAWALAGIIMALAVIPAVIMSIRRPGDWRQLFAHTIWDSHLSATLSHLWHNLASLALMFNWHGDDNWLHNLSGQPMLNAFVGIMFLLGLIVVVVQSRRLAYRALIAWWLGGLVVPALALGNAPDSQRAALALPPTMILAAIGVGYMLDRWYATFPINAAARSTGWAAMALLLALSSYQGYVQYFVAWGNSSEVYNAYDEAGTAMARFASSAKYAGQRIVTVSPDNLAVISYLDYPAIPGNSTLYVPASGIAGFHTTATSHQFIIDRSQRDAAIAALRSRFGGGRLYPHYSGFNNAELFYVYEVNK